MKNRIGNITNYLAGAILLLLGFIYVFKSSFMPYHAQALNASWNTLDLRIQSLVLALMRAAGGGYIAGGITIIALQYRFSKFMSNWISWLILLLAFVVSSTSIYATAIVRLNTDGKPPTMLAIFGFTLAFIGFVFNYKATYRG